MRPSQTERQGATKTNGTFWVWKEKKNLYKQCGMSEVVEGRVMGLAGQGEFEEVCVEGCLNDERVGA